VKLDLGYGFQWRHWSKPYNGYYASHGVGSNANGIDQLSNVVKTIRKNPNDRRMIVSAWNVSELNKMALEPCHLLYQFNVTDGKLNLAWYQRSNDFFLRKSFQYK
jgi:thymidylate synthase